MLRFHQRIFFMFAFYSQQFMCYHLYVYFVRRYGRRGPLVFAVIFQLITGIATAFAPYFWLFCTLRFFTAIATGGTMVTR